MFYVQDLFGLVVVYKCGGDECCCRWVGWLFGWGIGTTWRSWRVNSGWLIFTKFMYIFDLVNVLEYKTREAKDYSVGTGRYWMDSTFSRTCWTTSKRSTLNNSTNLEKSLKISTCFKTVYYLFTQVFCWGFPDTCWLIDRSIVCFFFSVSGIQMWSRPTTNILNSVTKYEYVYLGIIN